MSEQHGEPIYNPAIERALITARLRELSGLVALSAFEFISEDESVQLLSGIASILTDDGEPTGNTHTITVLYYLNQKRHLAKTIGFPNPAATHVYNLWASSDDVERYAGQRNARTLAIHDAGRRYFLDHAVFSSCMAEAALESMMLDEFRFRTNMQYLRIAEVK